MIGRRERDAIAWWARRKYQNADTPSAVQYGVCLTETMAARAKDAPGPEAGGSLAKLRKEKQARRAPLGSSDARAGAAAMGQHPAGGAGAQGRQHDSRLDQVTGALAAACRARRAGACRMPHEARDHSGVKLIHLVEVAFALKIVDYYPEPATDLERLENVVIACRALRACMVSVPDEVAPHDVVSANAGKIFTLLWCGGAASCIAAARVTVRCCARRHLYEQYKPMNRRSLSQRGAACMRACMHLSSGAHGSYDAALDATPEEKKELAHRPGRAQTSRVSALGPVLCCAALTVSVDARRT